MPNTRLMAVNETLRQLSFELASGSHGLSQHLDAIADLLKVAIGCPRVTVWLLHRQQPEASLSCTAWSSFSRSLKLTRCALPEEAIRAYLDSLLVGGVLAVPDIRQDASLQALNTAYCEPEEIFATLDAAFVVNGQAVGVVCCEQIGAVRHWMPEEVAVVRRTAQAVTLDLARLADGVQPGDDCSPDVQRLMEALRHS